MNRIKLYFTKDNNLSAFSFASRRKESLIASLRLLGESLFATLNLIGDLLTWFLVLLPAIWLSAHFAIIIWALTIGAYDMAVISLGVSLIGLFIGCAYADFIMCEERLYLPTIHTAYSLFDMVISSAKTPFRLVASIFNLTLFATHKFFSLCASESKPAFKPAPWKAPRVDFSKGVEVREHDPESPLSETNDSFATTSFSAPA